MKKYILVLGVIVVAAILLSGFWGKKENKENIVIQPADYKNTAYIVDGKSVQLVNGVAESEAAPGSASKTITRYFGNEVSGDLNGDGTEDTAFILTQEGGGSGVFYYAAVALKTTTGYKGTNAIFLGDRIAPQTMEIRNGTLIANYADRLPKEPMTTRPSTGKSKYLEIIKDELIEAPVFVRSPESGSKISSPLTVAGVAKGNRFFEGSFPIVLTDEKGNIVG